jgi:hypothetical protein
MTNQINNDLGIPLESENIPVAIMYSGALMLPVPVPLSELRKMRPPW